MQQVVKKQKPAKYTTFKEKENSCGAEWTLHRKMWIFHKKYCE
jgi:hypothetical protein